MRRIGDFAQSDYAVMKLAEEMQAMSMLYIQDAYFAEEDLNLDNLTYSNFLKEAEKARDGGPVAQSEFNRMLAKIIQGVIPSVMNPPQQGQPQPGGNQ